MYQSIHAMQYNQETPGIATVCVFLMEYICKIFFAIPSVKDLKAKEAVLG